MLSFNYYSRTNRIKKHKKIPSLHSLVKDHTRNKSQITTVLEMPFKRSYGMPIEKQHHLINEFSSQNMILGQLSYDNPQSHKQEISEQAMKQLELLNSIDENNKLNNILNGLNDVNPIEECHYTDQDQDIDRQTNPKIYDRNYKEQYDQVSKQSKSLSLEINLQLEQQRQQQSQSQQNEKSSIIQFENERMKQIIEKYNDQNIFEHQKNYQQSENQSEQNHLKQQQLVQIEKSSQQSQKNDQIHQPSQVQIQLDHQPSQIIQKQHSDILQQDDNQQESIPQQHSPIRIFPAQSQIVINFNDNMNSSSIPQSISTPLNSLLLQIYNTPQESKNSTYFKQLKKNQNVDYLRINSEQDLQVSQRLQATVRNYEFFADQLPPQGQPMFKKTISQFVSEEKSQDKSYKDLRSPSTGNQLQNKYKVPEESVIPQTKTKKNFKQTFIKKQPNSKAISEMLPIERIQQLPQRQNIISSEASLNANNLHNFENHENISNNKPQQATKKVNFKVMIKKMNK